MLCVFTLCVCVCVFSVRVIPRRHLSNDTWLQTCFDCTRVAQWPRQRSVCVCVYICIRECSIYRCYKSLCWLRLYLFFIFYILQIWTWASSYCSDRRSSKHNSGSKLFALALCSREILFKINVYFFSLHRNQLQIL